MGTRALVRKLGRLEEAAERLRARDGGQVLEALREDPARLMGLAGMDPDPWQQGLLRSPAARMLLLCSRQAGKSSVAAALALRSALLVPRSLGLLLSPSQRQSGALFRTVMDLFGD